MKILQNTKYICYGVVGAVALVPLAIKATETIPLTFNEGDVISAEVINNLLRRVNDVQRGFQTSVELDGSWNCTTSSRIQNDDARCLADGLLFKKSGVMNFDSAAGTWSYSGLGGNDGPQSCGSFPSRGSYEVRANRLILQTSVPDRVLIYPLTRANPDLFRWDGANVSIIECKKTSTPPIPVNNLTATASGNTVALTWVDQSTDEIGFKVQRKITAIGAWTDINTTGANTISFTESGLSAGIYWYRVLATNVNGDSISSSEVQATIQ